MTYEDFLNLTENELDKLSKTPLSEEEAANLIEFILKLNKDIENKNIIIENKNIKLIDILNGKN